MTKIANNAVDKQQVLTIVNTLLTKKQSQHLSKDFRNEIQNLKIAIDTLREDIGDTNSGLVSSKYVPQATDELDAIKIAAQEATQTIMGCTEQVEELSMTLDDANKEKLQDLSTNIYEACAFQDITGQRITKVITALKSIESSVEALTKALQDSLPYEESESRDGEESEALANGPQLPENTVSQDDIDALLASL